MNAVLRAAQTRLLSGAPRAPAPVNTNHNRWGRALLATGVLTAPWMGVLAFEGAHRGRGLAKVVGSASLAYVSSVVLSCLIWASLLYGGARRKSWLGQINAALFVMLYALALGGQRYFWEQYRTYMSGELAWFAADFLTSIRGQLLADVVHYSRVTLPFVGFGWGLVYLARRLFTPTTRASLSGWLVLVACLAAPFRLHPALAATPDLLYLNAIGDLARSRWGCPSHAPEDTIRPRHSLTVPRLLAESPLKRNVLLMIVESTRADSACISYDPHCLVTQYSNELAKERVPLFSMRAVDTVTATSLAVLTAGFGPNESVEVMHTWPLIFDYARAAGFNTGFWTSQNLDFGKSRLWVQALGVSKGVSGTELDANADIDCGADERLLAERVQSDLDQLEEPFLAVVQLSNVHHPYWVAPDLPQPFQPARFTKSPDEQAEFFNYYRNAVHQEDYHVATILRHLRATERGSRTVVLYTADHGEAFREHGLLGHSLSLYEEELHVPAWMDAPSGTLTQAEREALRAKSYSPTYHLDIVPTILDLLGVWHDTRLTLFKQRMPGHSLLQPALTAGIVPLTNCSAVWGCAFENWGVMRGTRKLIARAGDANWRCFDVAQDPGDQRDLGPAACGDLRVRALALFGRLPAQ